jgi:hypothetical protein
MDGRRKVNNLRDTTVDTKIIHSLNGNASFKF